MAKPIDPEILEGLLRKLEDIANSQAALVEKIATAQTQAEEAGVADLAVKLGEPFSNASKNADLVRALKGEAEKARDRAKAAPPKPAAGA
jgi:hypothetical protein